MPRCGDSLWFRRKVGRRGDGIGLRSGEQFLKEAGTVALPIFEVRL